MQIFNLVALFAFTNAFGVSLFQHTQRGGEKWAFATPKPGSQCKDVPEWFNDQTSSATWVLANWEEDLPSTNICFYEHSGCTGDMRCFGTRLQTANDFVQMEFNDKVSSVWTEAY
jgi:hypothetical protein